jgi:hypothetical protein
VNTNLIRKIELSSLQTARPPWSDMKRIVYGGAGAGVGGAGAYQGYYYYTSQFENENDLEEALAEDPGDVVIVSTTLVISYVPVQTDAAKI